MGVGPALSDNWLAHKVMHAALGAGTSALRGDDPLSGAMGAVIAEIAAELIANANTIYDDVGTEACKKAEQSTPELQKERAGDVFKHKMEIAKLVTGVVALSLGLETETAIQTATNALDHNSWEEFGRKIHELQGGVTEEMRAEEAFLQEQMVLEDFLQKAKGPLSLTGGPSFLPSMFDKSISYVGGALSFIVDNTIGVPSAQAMPFPIAFAPGVAPGTMVIGVSQNRRQAQARADDLKYLAHKIVNFFEADQRRIAEFMSFAYLYWQGSKGNQARETTGPKALTFPGYEDLSPKILSTPAYDGPDYHVNSTPIEDLRPGLLSTPVLDDRIPHDQGFDRNRQVNGMKVALA